MRPTAQEIEQFNVRIQSAIRQPLNVILPVTSSTPEDSLAWQLTQLKVPHERQYRIHPVRRFRADFYFAAGPLVVEVEGGGFIRGRHSRGKGIESDAEKSTLIAHMPARLIRVTPRHVKNGQALDWILKALATR